MRASGVAEQLRGTLRAWTWTQADPVCSPAPAAHPWHACCLPFVLVRSCQLRFWQVPAVTAAGRRWHSLDARELDGHLFSRFQVLR